MHLHVDNAGVRALPNAGRAAERPDLEEVFATSPREGRKWFLHDERWAPAQGACRGGTSFPFMV